MSIFTEDDLRTISRKRTKNLAKSADRVLRDDVLATAYRNSFDVFLSHSIKDSEIILGVKAILEEQDLSVYVDWIDDPELSRREVTADTAERLRDRMKQSKLLIYAHSNNSPDSKWMPWELGFFDGYKSAVAVFPIARTEYETFKGQEFLGIYPYIDKVGASVFVNKGNSPLSRLGNTEPGRSFRFLRDWLRDRTGIAP